MGMVCSNKTLFIKRGIQPTDCSLPAPDLNSKDAHPHFLYIVFIRSKSFKGRGISLNFLK